MKRNFPLGSLWVALGSALWALDAIPRSRLVGHYSAFFLVFFSQILCAVIVLPVCWKHRREIRALEWREWAAFLFLAVASNVLAMAAFTRAFALTANFSTPVLIQKLQPFIVIFTAVVFLREKTPPRYYLYCLIALAGSLLVTLGSDSFFAHAFEDLRVIGYSLLAALFWGMGTTLGRFVSLRHSFWMVTSLRYALAVLFMLIAFPLWVGDLHNNAAQIWLDLPNFLFMASVPGIVALFLYYRGMQTTRATLACWLELTYPVAAIVVNWAALGSRLSLAQISGAMLLLFSVSWMSFENARELDHEPGH